MASRIIGTGHYLPPQRLGNTEFIQRFKLNTNDEWIQQRTGIQHRHFVTNEKTSTLAHKAAQAALNNANIKPQSIDLIIVATTTPEWTFPSTAALVQNQLGNPGFCYDIQAVCAGFVFALSAADNAIAAGQAKRVLVIGAEIYSAILDFSDRTTAVLFGDGAGAVILEKTQAIGELDPNKNLSGVNGRNDHGLICSVLHTQGARWKDLYVDGGVSATGTIGKLRMNGREVFRHAIINMSNVVDEALTQAGLERNDIDWLIPHQANKRIMNQIGNMLALPESKIISTVEEHANISAASIPVAMDLYADKFRPGDLLALTALGGGYAWGCNLLRWG